MHIWHSNTFYDCADAVDTQFKWRDTQRSAAYPMIEKAVLMPVIVKCWRLKYGFRLPHHRQMVINMCEHEKAILDACMTTTSSLADLNVQDLDVFFRLLALLSYPYVLDFVHYV